MSVRTLNFDMNCSKVGVCTSEEEKWRREREMEECVSVLREQLVGALTLSLSTS